MLVEQKYRLQFVEKNRLGHQNILKQQLTAEIAPQAFTFIGDELISYFVYTEYIPTLSKNVMFSENTKGIFDSAHSKT